MKLTSGSLTIFVLLISIRILAQSSAEKTEGRQNPKISLVAIAENIDKHDIAGIQNATKPAGVKSFDKYYKKAKAKNFATGTEDSVISYKSKEPIFTSNTVPYYFRIQEFDNGDVQVWYSLQAEEVEPATKEIKEAGFVFKGKSGVFDVYLKDSIVIKLPPIGAASGGTCYIYKIKIPK